MRLSLPLPKYLLQQYSYVAHHHVGACDECACACVWPRTCLDAHWLGGKHRRTSPMCWSGAYHLMHKAIAPCLVLAPTTITPAPHLCTPPPSTVCPHPALLQPVTPPSPHRTFSRSHFCTSAPALAIMGPSSTSYPPIWPSAIVLPAVESRQGTTCTKRMVSAAQRVCVCKRAFVYAPLGWLQRGLNVYVWDTVVGLRLCVCVCTSYSSK